MAQRKKTPAMRGAPLAVPISAAIWLSVQAALVSVLFIWPLANAGNWPWQVFAFPGDAIKNIGHGTAMPLGRMGPQLALYVMLSIITLAVLSLFNRRLNT